MAHKAGGIYSLALDRNSLQIPVRHVVDRISVGKNSWVGLGLQIGWEWEVSNGRRRGTFVREG